MASRIISPQISILIINPNTSTQITDALKPIVEHLNYNIEFDYFTAPSVPVTLPDGRVIDGISSIDSGDDSAKSALHCWAFLKPLIPKYDAFLVACFSAHPLVGMLREAIKDFEETCRENQPIRGRKYVTGIFEAGITTSLMLISAFQLADNLNLKKQQAADTFGIVTTGSVWKPELITAVNQTLVSSSSQAGANTQRFAGVETTNLTASQLHQTPPGEVRKRMMNATERLLKSATSPVSAVCLGCAGMAGMEEAVREGCVKAYGKEGKYVRIIDGVVAGIGMLINACKASF